MKINNIYKLSFLLIFALYGCNSFESDESKKLTEMNEKLIGINDSYKNKKIELSEELYKDVFKNKKEDSFSMLVYYDANCSVCFTKLKEWINNIDYFKKVDENLNIKFILYSDDPNLTDINLESTDFPKSLIVYNNDNSYLKKYEHLIEYPFNTMLLNKDNEIVFIGSPKVSDNLKEHYTKLIKQHAGNRKG